MPSLWLSSLPLLSLPLSVLSPPPLSVLCTVRLSVEDRSTGRCRLIAARLSLLIAVDWSLLDWSLLDWSLLDWSLLDWSLLDWSLLDASSPE